MLEALANRDRVAFWPCAATWLPVILVYGLFAAGSIQALFCPARGWSHCSSDRSIAEIQARMFCAAVVLHARQMGTLPASLEGLTAVDSGAGEPILECVPLDPWRRAYRYRVLGRDSGRFEVRSVGKDGDFGTEDDVVATDGPGGRP